MSEYSIICTEWEEEILKILIFKRSVTVINGKNNMFEQYILITYLDANYVNIVEPSQV